MLPETSRRSAWRAAATAVLAVAIACGGGTGSDSASAPKATAASLPAPRTLGDLTSVGDMAKAFDANRGRLRLVLLLSPT